MICSMNEACSEFSKGILDFVKNRTWYRATWSGQIFNEMVSSSCSLFDGDKKITKGLDWPDASIDTGGAALFLRDHLVRTTGKRIWGLTFTLFPDGKFDIEYDYNKPADYDDSEEHSTDADSDTPAANLLGGLLDVAPTSNSDDFLNQALAALQIQTANNSAAWGLGTEAQWNLDMAAGTLRLSFDDGRVLKAPVQVIGTYNTKNGSFLWGWDHPSVPQPLRRAAQCVHDYGVAHNEQRFTTRSVECTQDDAWRFTAAAAQLDKAAGAYRGDVGGTWVYMVFAIETDAATN